MVTLTFNSTALIFAGIVVFLGLVVPGYENDDVGKGFLWAFIIIVLALVTYAMIVGLYTMIG